MHGGNIHIRVPRWCWCIYYIYVYTNIYAIGACALCSALLPTTRHLAWSPGRTVAWPKNLSNSHFPFCFAPFSWRPKAHFCMRALAQLFRLVCWRLVLISDTHTYTPKAPSTQVCVRVYVGANWPQLTPALPPSVVRHIDLQHSWEFSCNTPPTLLSLVWGTTLILGLVLLRLLCRS